MRDTNPCRAAESGETAKSPAQQAQQLIALACQARLFEFALEGNDVDAHRLAAEIEAALEQVIDAESAAELSDACSAIESALATIVDSGMRLTVELADLPFEGVLGTARMPVLTAVLSSAREPRA